MHSLAYATMRLPTRGVVGRERVKTGFPHPFHVLL